MTDSYNQQIAGGNMPGATPDSASASSANSSSVEGHRNFQTRTSVPQIVVQPASNQGHNNGISPFVPSPPTRRPPPPPVSNPAFLEVPRRSRPPSRRGILRGDNPSPSRPDASFRNIDLSVTGPIGPIHPLRMHPVRFVSSTTMPSIPAVGNPETSSSSGDLSLFPSSPGSSFRHIPPSVTGPIHPLRMHPVKLTSSPTMPVTAAISRPGAILSSDNLSRPHPMPPFGLTSSSTMPATPAISRPDSGPSSGDLSRPHPMTAGAHLTYEDEIQQKIEKMLAASAALKANAAPAPVPETAAPEPPSFRRRLLKKMVSVPDLSARLFSKNKNKGDKKPKPPLTIRHMHMTGALAELPLPEHPGPVPAALLSTSATGSLTRMVVLMDAPVSAALTPPAATDSLADPSRSTRLPTEFESHPRAHPDAPPPALDARLPGRSRQATNHRKHHQPPRPTDFGVFARGENNSGERSSNKKIPTKPPTPTPTPTSSTPPFAPVSVMSVIGRQPPPFPSHDTPHAALFSPGRPFPSRDTPRRMRASPSTPATAFVVGAGPGWAIPSLGSSVPALPALPSLPSLLPPPPPHQISARRRAHNALARKRHPAPGLDELERLEKEVREQLRLEDLACAGAVAGVRVGGRGSGGGMVVVDGPDKGTAVGSAGGALSLGGGTFARGVGFRGLGGGERQGGASAWTSREEGWGGSRCGSREEEEDNSGGEESEEVVGGGLRLPPGLF